VACGTKHALSGDAVRGRDTLSVQDQERPITSERPGLNDAVRYSLGRFDMIGLGEEEMAELPIVCTLTPDALRTRREGLLSDLVRQAEGHEDLSEDLRLRFTPTGDTLSTIARAVEAERHCCRFLRFGISVEPDGGPMVLELSGPPGTREFIAALLEV
jgi:hypothetical protein